MNAGKKKEYDFNFYRLEFDFIKNCTNILKKKEDKYEKK
jgi:hypothetical protein